MKNIAEMRKYLEAKGEEIRERKRQEFKKQVKDYYDPDPVDEQELKRKELAKHVDYLKRLKERHERGEL